MGLYLVQHGKSLPKEEDPDKGLSSEGTKEVERIAQMAKEHGVRVSSIKHSGKKRARQTAEILAAGLRPSEGSRRSGASGRCCKFCGIARRRQECDAHRASSLYGETCLLPHHPFGRQAGH
jgi:hypothetical protein